MFLSLFSLFRCWGKYSLCSPTCCFVFFVVVFFLQKNTGSVVLLFNFTGPFKVYFTTFKSTFLGPVFFFYCHWALVIRFWFFLRVIEKLYTYKLFAEINKHNLQYTHVSHYDVVLPHARSILKQKALYSCVGQKSPMNCLWRSLGVANLQSELGGITHYRLSSKRLYLHHMLPPSSHPFSTALKPSENNALSIS